MLNQIPSFLSSFKPDSIKCSYHKGNTASSFCMDCNAFICLDSTCGHPHVFHSVENINTMISSLIIPTLNSLAKITQSKNSSSQYVSSLNKIKNNLRSFSIGEKEKINTQYKTVLSSLQTIYSTYLSQIDLLIDSINNKFDDLLNQILGVDSSNDSQLNAIMNDINKCIYSSKENCGLFIMGIGKKIKEYKKTINELTKIKGNKINVEGEEFEKKINAIKDYVKDNYKEIENKGEQFFKDINSSMKNSLVKIKEDTELFKKKLNAEKETRRISKIKISVNNFKKLNNGIDLDLFARELHNTINSYRANPEKLLSIINNNYYCVNDNSQFSFAQKKKIDYIRNYLSNLAEVKSNLDWDNDLSNSSEDYFKTHSNDIEKDNKKMNIEIKKILSESYYSEEAYLNLISTLSYAKVKPDIDEIILLALFNETNWDFISGENFLFDEKFNLIGIYAVPFNSNPNLINMIVNVGYFKHEQEQ